MFQKYRIIWVSIIIAALGGLIGGVTAWSITRIQYEEKIMILSNELLGEKQLYDSLEADYRSLNYDYSELKKSKLGRHEIS